MRKFNLKTSILALSLIFLLPGCSIDQQRIEWANHVCEPNDGVKEIYRLGGITYVFCENGARFKGHQFK